VSFTQFFIANLKALIMRNYLLTFLAVLTMAFSINAQVVYEDFEGTPLEWNPFGDGVYNGAVDNPDVTGLNASAKCGSYTKSTEHSYSLLITVLDEPMDLSVNNEFRLMINAPVATQVLLKLENEDNSFNIEATKNITVANVWQEYVFDFSAAAGQTTINKIIIFFDPGVTESGDTYLFDNIEAHPAGPCAGTVPDPAIMDDFECQRNVSYGGGWEYLAAVANPDASGVNTSTGVGEFTDLIGEPWSALAIDYNSAIDLSTNNQFKIKIWSPKVCQFLFKLEGGVSPAYEVWEDISTTNTWVEYTIDFSSQAAADHKKIAIFFNGGQDGEDGDIYYIDDMGMTEAPAPDALENFEDGQSLGWVPFGGDTDNNGFFGGVVDNPDASGANESPNVGEYSKGNSVWSTLTAILPLGLDLSVNPQLNLDVWAPAGSIGVIMKLSSPLEGNKEVSREIPVTEEWVTLEFNFDEFSSITDFESVSFIFDGGEDNAGTMYFFDNLVQSQSTVDPCESVVAIPNILDDYECQRNVVYGAGAEFISAIENPAVTAENPSAKVGEYQDPIDEWSALGFESGGSWDLSVYNQLRVKIWSPAEVPVMFKLEGGASPAKEVWTDGNITANGWVEYVVDFSDQAMEDHARLAIFFNAGQTPSESVSYFIDDVEWKRANYSGCIADNESPNTTISNFLYFANGHIEQEDGQLYIVDNPAPGGINTSSKVGQFTKASDSDPWAGAYALLGAPMDFGETKIAKAKVWMTHIGNFAIKLENSATGADNIELPVANTLTEEWEELTFDFSSIPDDAQFQTLTVFFDLLIDATGEDVTSFFDDIVIGDYSCGTVIATNQVDVANFNVSPNPVHHELFVETSEEVSQILIFNTFGQQAGRTVYTNGTQNVTVDVANLSKGMYFLSLIDSDGTLVGKAKFIKE
jgi:hypothetical protein